MKKTISKFLLLSILCVPFAVKADMGAPMIKDYEGVITTDRGVVCKNNNKKVILNKGDQVKVYGTIDTNGVIDYYVATKDGYECDIKVGEFVPIDEEIRPTTENAYDTKTNNKIYTNAEIIIRKGPDDLYTEVGRIPADTTIYYRYEVGGEAFGYVYVEYNGVKGWIKTHTKDIIKYIEQPESYQKFIAMTDTTTKCGDISRNTVVAAVKAYGNGGYILKYNDCEFDSEPVTTLLQMATEMYGEFTKEANIYEFADKKSRALGKVGKGDIPVFIASYWSTQEQDITLIYLEHKGVRGWVFTDDADIKYPEDEPDTTTTTTAPIKERTTKKPKPLRKKRNTNMVIICSIVAGCLALTALVVIIIINKKKKGKVKKEEVKSEDTIKEVKMEETEETSEEKTEDDKSEETEPEEIKEDTE